MTEKGQDTNKQKRVYWLDNLRTFMIFLVLVFHASIVYDKYAIGAAWWIVIDPSTSDLPGILNVLIDIFVMPTIFFIAGCVTPLSLKDKTGWAFLTIQIYTTDHSLDDRCVDVNSTVQNDLFIRSKSPSRTLDHLLSLERNVESKLALVSPGAVCIQQPISIALKSQCIKNYSEGRSLGRLSFECSV